MFLPHLHSQARSLDASCIPRVPHWAEKCSPFSEMNLSISARFFLPLLIFCLVCFPHICAGSGLAGCVRLLCGARVHVLQHMVNLRSHQVPTNQRDLRCWADLCGCPAIWYHSLECFPRQNLRLCPGEHLQHERVLHVLSPVHCGLCWSWCHRHCPADLHDGYYI